DDNERNETEQRDRREILQRIVRKFAIEIRIDHKRAARGNEERVSVGRRFDDGFDANDAVRACAIVDNKRLAHHVAEFLADDASDDIRRLTRRKRDDDTHGLCWVCLRISSERYCGERYGRTTCNDRKYLQRFLLCFCALRAAERALERRHIDFSVCILRKLVNDEDVLRALVAEHGARVLKK